MQASCDNHKGKLKQVASIKLQLKYNLSQKDKTKKSYINNNLILPRGL